MSTWMKKGEIAKFILGETWEEATRRPSLQETLNHFRKEVVSGPVIRLGTGSEDVLMALSERIHMHIIGEPGMGKSKFLEYLMRWDIEHGKGFLFIDPSMGGRTAYAMLKYLIYL
jgi:hypothetical protein